MRVLITGGAGFIGSNVFYCDIRRARQNLGWKPVDRLLGWIAEDREEISRFLAHEGIRVATG
jgi:nucleoside-diphosphate-sugar epimerase